MDSFTSRAVLFLFVGDIELMELQITCSKAGILLVLPCRNKTIESVISLKFQIEP